MRRILATALLPLLSGGCTPSTCLPGDDDPVISLGQGVGGAFAPYIAGQTVTIEPASQGGFGFPVLIQTVGLAAGDGDATVIMETVVEGAVTGTWTQDTRLTCPSDGDGGRTPSALHVGFDSSVYRTTDDFIDLVGVSVDLDVEMTDSEGNSAQVIQRVTLALGGE